jgi:hypothetical protein
MVSPVEPDKGNDCDDDLEEAPMVSDFSNSSDNEDDAMEVPEAQSNPSPTLTHAHFIMMTGFDFISQAQFMAIQVMTIALFNKAGKEMDHILGPTHLELSLHGMMMLYWMLKCQCL